MPIKAKPVSAIRAAAAAQGRMGLGGANDGKVSFYYDEVRRRAQVEADEDDSSSTSSGSCVADPVEVHSRRETAEMEEEELLALARERTQRFLYPESDKRYVPRPYVNNRVAVYEEATRQQLRKASTPSEEPEAHAPGLAQPSPPMVRTEAHQLTSSPSSPVVEPKSEEAIHVAASSDGSPSVHPEERQPAAASEAVDPLKRDFQKLLQLLGEDMDKERAAQNEPLKPVPASTGNTHDPGLGGYRPTARTFAELQEDTLLKLYDDWNQSGGDGTVFVASDHMAQAFSLAAARTEALGIAGTFRDEPSSLEHIAEIRAATATTHGIALSAQAELNRFLLTVAWTERLVRDPRFVESVAGYMYDKHRLFLPHFGAVAAGAPVTHSHEEFEAYEKFGTRTSETLLAVLSRHIPGFDEEWFVASLYDTPVGEAYDHDSPANILSFTAWRLLLAMSDFELFFTWMMDYIQEEYNVAPSAADNIPVGGARGLRALLRSTYQRNRESSLFQVEDQFPRPTEEEVAEGDSGTWPPALAPESVMTPPIQQQSSPLVKLGVDAASSSMIEEPESSSKLQSNLCASSGSPVRPVPPTVTHTGNPQYFATLPASAGGTASRPTKRRLQVIPGRDLPPIPVEGDDSETPNGKKVCQRGRSRSQEPRLGLGPGKVGPVPHKPTGIRPKGTTSKKREVAETGTRVVNPKPRRPL